MTSLTLYLSNVATTTLTTAAALASATGGTIAGDSSLIGTSTGYGELYGLGNAGAWAAAGSIGSPSGNGWLWDVTTLVGQTIAAGTWTPTLRVRVSSGTATIDYHVQYFKRSSGGTYTLIGNVNQTGVAMTTAYQTLTPGASLGSMAFATGDKLYMHVWPNITANSTGSGSAVLFITVTTSATQGDTTGAQVTPGYATTTVAEAATLNGIGKFTATLSPKVPETKTLTGIGTFTETLSAKVPESKTLNGVGKLTAAPSYSAASTLHGIGKITLIPSYSTKATLSGIATFTATPHYIQTKATLNAIGKFTATATIKIGMSATFSGRGIFISKFPIFLVCTFSGTGKIVARPVAGGTGLVAIINTTPVFIIRGTLQIQMAIARRSTANFQVYTPNINTYFTQNESIFIYDNGVLLFSGYISQPQATKVGYQPSLVQTLQCVDQHYLADKRIVAASYFNASPGAIARQLMNTYLAVEGVTEGLIVDTGLFPSETLYPSKGLYPASALEQFPVIQFNYVTIASAFDTLVSLANDNGIPFYWQIDQNKQLWFVPYMTLPSPIVIDGTLVEQKLNPITVNRQNPLYRNTQYILGGTAQTVLQVETKKGDGVATSWVMGYDVSTMPIITVDGNPKKVGLKGINSGYDFYWQKGDPSIEQDTNGTILTTSNTLSVSYYGQYDAVVVSQDQGLISLEAQREGGTSGVVEAVANDPTVTSITQGFTLASNYIARYGQDGIQLNFFTMQQGYVQGQSCLVNLPMFGLINTYMLIESVTVCDNVDGLNIWYNVSCVVGPYDTTWVSFFSVLVANALQTASSSIQLSQTLNLLVSSSITFTFSGTATITVDSPPLPSETLYPSETLFP